MNKENKTPIESEKISDNTDEYFAGGIIIGELLVKNDSIKNITS